MVFLLLILAMGATADYYEHQQLPPQDAPMPTSPPPPPPVPVPQTPYETQQPEPEPTLPPTVAPDTPEPVHQEYNNYGTYEPQQPVTLPPFVPDTRPCDLCPAVHTNFNPALVRTANCRALGIDFADYEILSAMTIDTTTSSSTCQKTIQCSEYASDTIWIGTFQGEFGCWHDNVHSYETTCQDGKFIDQDGDHIQSLVCLKKVDRYTQPPQPVTPPVPDTRPCDLCPAVHTNFNPALVRNANCRALGIDFADYEILSAMTVNTTTSSDTCQKTIQCSEYASDTIWIGTFQGEFGCWHDNVRSYETTCQDGKFIDQDGDHIQSLVCLKKVDRYTQPPAPVQPQPQPYAPTDAPQPIPTEPPVIVTQAPDVPVPQANGYSGY